MRTYIGIFSAAFSLFACSSMSHETAYGPLYDRALRLCQEYELPNSMARPQGFDLSAHLATVSAERKNIAAQFSELSSQAYVQRRLYEEHDELDIACAKKLLSDAQHASK